MPAMPTSSPARQGAEATAATAEKAAELLGCPAKQVFLASTGVIGEMLPHERITAALPGLHAGLAETRWEDAARGIMTTDTFPKAATRTARIGDTEVTISGIAKGSGMIAPDMATMLCFVFTDAKIPRRGAAGGAQEGRQGQLQRHHGRFRHLDQRHRAALRDRPGEARAGARAWRQAAARLPRRARRPAARSGAPGRAGRRGRAEARAHRRGGRRIPQIGPAHRAWRSPTPRW